MRIAGIICEFNPFHEGHKYLIDNVRRELDPDAVVCIMSGNFVQRGQPALWNKWERAEAAVKGGADLVIQMPVCVSVSSAEYFAKGAVNIAAALNVSSLCFGSESGDIDYLKRLASEGINEIEEGNNILACEYIRAMPADMHPYTVKINKKLGHAKDIRNNYVNNIEIELFKLAQYKIVTSSTKELAESPEVSEGLENRMKTAVREAECFDDLILKIKSKRYNYTRISRAVLQTVLGIKSNVPCSLYAHVLAFNEIGQKLLSLYRDNEEITLYSNISPEDTDRNIDLETDVRSDDIYAILSGRSIYVNSDYVCKPVKTNI